jgi:tRNA uridine 5-carboxymethylaminomethyl modification enzyme
MIDDLITRGVSEPYRMFTSRAEYRLTLRADNADQRLTPIGIKLGCVSLSRQHLFEKKSETLDKLRGALMDLRVSPQEAKSVGISVGSDGRRRNGMELLSLPGVGIGDIKDLISGFDDVDQSVVVQVEADALYSNYIGRQERDIQLMKADENIDLPVDFDYSVLSSLSNELKDKLNKVRPTNLAHAGRIDGMTPAALSLILTAVQMNAKRRA